MEVDALMSMTFAVHSIWCPAVEIDDKGTMTHNEARISLPTPIHTADTLEDAERWRNQARERRNG